MKRSFLLLLATAPFLTAGFTVYADKPKTTGMPSVNEFHRGYNLGGTVTFSSDGIPLDRGSIKI